MNQQIDTIIFDLGGVLIDWNPAYVFDKTIQSEEERKYFFEKVCTHDWNEEQDAGKPLQVATEERILLFPEWETHIRSFYGRWEEMLGDSIEGTVQVFNRLREMPHLKMYALTNWSHETFPVALDRFEFLHRFDGILVSGEEKTRKPFPEIYQLLFDRFIINPERAVFIDDNLRNIKAGESFGLHGIHFNNPEQLCNELMRLGILPKN
jgi:2-haloacid dehalogenase